MDRIADDTSFNEEIYPLKGSGIAIDFSNISFGGCDSQLWAASNLSNYFCKHGNINYVGVKLHILIIFITFTKKRVRRPEQEMRI